MSSQSLLTISKTAKIVGVQRQTIYAWIEKARKKGESSRDPDSILYYLVNAEAPNGKRSYMMKKDFAVLKGAENQKVPEEMMDDAFSVYYTLYEYIEKKIEKESGESTGDDIFKNMFYIDGEISKYIYQYIKNREGVDEGRILPNKESRFYNLELSRVRDNISRMQFGDRELLKASISAMKSFIEILKKEEG